MTNQSPSTNDEWTQKVPNANDPSTWYLSIETFEKPHFKHGMTPSSAADRGRWRVFHSPHIGIWNLFGHSSLVIGNSSALFPPDP
ncbi:MAG: hypothetical protein WC058_05690 [Phycisphaeraceae bacterium]